MPHSAPAWILSLLLPVSASAAPPPADTPAAKAVGLELRALSGQDLDAIKDATGVRVGVLVTAVAAGSPAARGGLREGDLLVALGDLGVDSPESAEKALSGKTGKVEVAVLRRGEAGFQAIRAVLDIPAAPPLDAARPGTPGPETSGEAEIRRKLEALDAARAAGVLSEEEHTRKKSALLAAGTRAPESEKAPAGRQGQTFRHPIGFSFWHPSGWSVEDRTDALRLLPPDPGGTAADPTEVYLIVAESVAGTGIREPEDPRVAAHFDEQVRALAPFLRREGKAEPAEMARGRGAVLDWRGKNPRGDAIRARAFVAVLEDHGVALVALGVEERVAARDADLRRMFATFGFGEGDRDATLVGAWDIVSTYALRNDSPYETAATRASSVSETQSRLVIRADGTFTRTDVSQTIVMGAGVSLESGPEKKVRQGKWNAGNGTLYLRWGDDWWMVYRYRLQREGAGVRLLLEVEGRGETWQPAK